MALELTAGEPLGPGVRRVIAEGIDATIEALDGPPDADAVHTARKTLKVVRAALRLVESAFDGDDYAAEDRALRDAARPLSAVRDAQVAVDVLAGLRKHFRDELPPTAFAAVAKHLARRSKAAGLPPDPVSGGLRAARDRVADWPLDDVGWAVVGAGLEAQYRAGRRAMKRAVGHPDDDDVHDWRKRVKDHRHQLEILKPLWPEVMPAFASAARTLGTLLGDDHDLAVLAQLIDGEPAESVPAADRPALAALIARRRQALQGEADRLGHRVYADHPAAFARRLHQYWKAARAFD